MIQALISTLVYQAVCANAELAGTLWDFLLATACLLVAMFVIFMKFNFFAIM